MIRTLAVAAALAGALLLAPVAQAQPQSSTCPGSHPNVNGAAVLCGPALGDGNKVAPNITATPFGAAGTFFRQPGLAIANANGNLAVPNTTGRPFGSVQPMAQGNKVVPATSTRSLGGGIRTRHGRGTSLLEALGGLFG